MLMKGYKQIRVFTNGNSDRGKKNCFKCVNEPRSPLLCCSLYKKKYALLFAPNRHHIL